MARSKGSHDISPQVRGGLIRALKIIENKSGRSLSDLFVEAIEQHGILHVLNVAAKYNPKTLDVGIDMAAVVLDTTQLPDDVMEQIHEYRRQADAEPTGSAGQVH